MGDKELIELYEYCSNHVFGCIECKKERECAMLDDYNFIPIDFDSAEEMIEELKKKGFKYA